MVWTRPQALDKGLVEPNPYRELYNHGPKTAEGVNTGLFVHGHGGPGPPLGVLGVLLLELAHAGLQGRHGPHLADLLDGEG